MSGNKSHKDQLRMRSEVVIDDFEDMDREINSRRGASNISSGGSNPCQNSGLSGKKPREKGLMDHFFTSNLEKVVQNRCGKITQTIINAAYKETIERAWDLIARWVYEVVIPFNAVTYPSFKQKIAAISQYGVGMKPPSVDRIRVPQLN